MATAVEMFQARDGSVHKTAELADAADARSDGKKFMKILDENIKIDHGCIFNHYEVLADLTAFLVNNNIHKSQQSMRNFITVLDELREEAGEA